MKLHIINEYSPLQDVIVCWGDAVPDYKTYACKDPEFTKYHKRSWDKHLLLKQQEKFFEKLSSFGVQLHFLKTDPNLPHQMYTRDTAFVINNHLYFSQKREFPDRDGEIRMLQDLLTSLKITDLREIRSGSIEGGDVIVDPQTTYIGNGSRTSKTAIDELMKLEHCTYIFLGDNVMHFDTRFTLLPRNIALIIPEAIQETDLEMLKKRYTLIPVLQSEAVELETNVLVVNPETLFSPTHNVRINDELRKAGFHVETVDYTEPINLGGSFRCTTLPLGRG